MNRIRLVEMDLVKEGFTQTVRICRCGEENRDGANFCGACGAKLVEVCNCWVKKEPYNCGQVECPGYRLFLLEKRAAQSQANLALDDLATKVDKEDNMNKEQYERAIAALLSAMEELGKAATPAHCEAMAKVAAALTELHKSSDRIRG